MQAHAPASVSSGASLSTPSAAATVSSVSTAGAGSGEATAGAGSGEATAGAEGFAGAEYSSVTSSMTAMGALSPLRGPILVIRV